MGGMDGMALIGLIRATESPVRIVILSGFVEGFGLDRENHRARTKADHKSNKEVPELLRAVRETAGAVRTGASPPPGGRGRETKAANAG